MKFFYRKEEDNYEFKLTDSIYVELCYMASPFNSTLRLIDDTKGEEFAVAIHPLLAKGIRQYYRENSKNSIENESFVNQLKAWGLKKVASHVNDALFSIPKDDSCRLA
jgi:hypothetical protein